MVVMLVITIYNIYAEPTDSQGATESASKDEAIPDVEQLRKVNTFLPNLTNSILHFWSKRPRQIFLTSLAKSL